jgi:hypothetical protein
MKKYVQKEGYDVVCSCRRGYYTEYKPSECPHCGRTNGSRLPKIAVFALIAAGLITFGYGICYFLA